MNIKIYTDTRRANKDGEYPISISINRDGFRFYVKTGLSTPEKITGREFPKSVPNFRTKTNALNAFLVKVEEYCMQHQFDQNEELRAGLMEYITGKPHKARGHKLVDIFEEYIEKKDMKHSRHVNCMCSLNKLKEFDKDIYVETITDEWIEAFMKFLEKDLKHNSAITYIEIIKSAILYALKKKKIANNPFAFFRMKKTRPIVNDLSIEQIKFFRDCELPKNESVFRDLMMLSFYLCGMNPIDLFEAEGLKNGRFAGYRIKTGVDYDLPIFPEAKELIEKLKGETRLLYMHDKYKSFKSFYVTMARTIRNMGTVTKVKGEKGRMVRKIEPLFGDFPLTFYTMRYSFASIAAELEIPRDYIDVCLAHTFSDMNAHYIRYKRKSIDAAIRKVLDAIK